MVSGIGMQSETAPTYKGTPVNFADPAFEYPIKRQLDKPDGEILDNERNTKWRLNS